MLSLKKPGLGQLSSASDFEELFCEKMNDLPLFLEHRADSGVERAPHRHILACSK